MRLENKVASARFEESCPLFGPVLGRGRERPMGPGQVWGPAWSQEPASGRRLAADSHPRSPQMVAVKPSRRCWKCIELFIEFGAARSEQERILGAVCSIFLEEKYFFTQQVIFELAVSNETPDGFRACVFLKKSTIPN